MLRVTLDTNCLLDLESENERTTALKDLVARHQAREIELRIPAISASERQRRGIYLDNFKAFEERLARLGLAALPHILPICYLGVGFWDHCLLAGEELTALERKIHEILHPGIEFEYEVYRTERGLPADAEVDRKWRNAKCDVQVMWSHIWHKGDLLVSNDENFMKVSKRPRLIELGAGEILRPLDAASYLCSADLCSRDDKG